MKYSMIAVCSALCLSVPMAASAYSVNAVDEAVNNTDSDALSRYAADSDEAYVRSYALYRSAVFQMQAGDIERAGESLQQAMDELQPAQDSESYVLKAAITGMQMGLDPINAAPMVERQQRYLAQADALNADNPRADIVRGMAAFYTPAAFGGGAEKAQSYFNQAVNKFAEPCEQICWGEAEAHTWLGLVEQQQGNNDEARYHWQQALLVDSDYGWAHYLLTTASNMPAE